MARTKGSIVREITERDLEQIATMSGLGMPNKYIAAVLGIPLATFSRRLNEDPRINETIQKGRASAAAQVTKTAYELAKSGKVPAMTMFWLKCRLNWSEAPVSDPEEDKLDKKEELENRKKRVDEIKKDLFSRN